MSDSTRVELDLVVVSRKEYSVARIELLNHHDIFASIADYFPDGAMIRLHIIAEDTGEIIPEESE